MSLDDRDWWREAQRKKDLQRTRDYLLSDSGRSQGKTSNIFNGPNGTYLIVLFWLAIAGALYLAASLYLKPKPQIITASGDLVLPRDRDGHFYAVGSVNGQSVRFLVDTDFTLVTKTAEGPQLVTVSEQFAGTVGLTGGVPTFFKTANGDLPGRIVPEATVEVGPLAVSDLRVGVGFLGQTSSNALLGQNFLSKFDISLDHEQMILHKRQ